jgi:hypothetical protein
MQHAAAAPSEHARDARNPILCAGSRVPAWAAMAVVMFLFACWLATDTPDELAFSSTGTWWLGLAIVILAAIPQRAELGADGMLVTWLGAPRLIRYETITRASPVGDEDVVLVLDSGESLKLRSPMFSPADARTVLVRIWRALAAGAEERVHPHERAALARAGRRTEAWAEALAKVAAAGAQYRQAIPIERLVDIATNPAVSVELRAAAAVAAGAAGALDAPARARIADAGSQSADGRLRAALASVAAARTSADLAAALAAV